MRVDREQQHFLRLALICLRIRRKSIEHPTNRMDKVLLGLFELEGVKGVEKEKRNEISCGMGHVRSLDKGCHWLRGSRP